MKLPTGVPVESAKYLAVGSGLLSLALAYYTGWKNKYSKLEITKEYSLASVSTAMHFCNKPLIISLMAVSYFSALFVFMRYPHGYILAISAFAIYIGLISLMFLIDNCDCSGTRYPTCCKPKDGVDMTSAGQCTVDDLATAPTEKIGQPGGCCNPPWCTKEENDKMGKTHMTIAIGIMIMSVLFVWLLYYLSQKSWSPVRRKAAIALCVMIFANSLLTVVFDKAGSSFDIPFYFSEGAQLVLFLMSYFLM